MANHKVKQTPALARHLKSRHVQLIALGGTIGTGLFLGAGKAIYLAGPAIIWAYLLTGVMCFLLMRALGELLLSDLSALSFVEFITRYLGQRLGTVAGWIYWLCWITIAMTEITAIGVYMRFWFPALPQWLPGLLFLVLLLGLNLFTVGAFGEVEFWFALIKIIAILALIGTGIFMLSVHFKTSSGHATLTNLMIGGLFPTGIKGFILSFQMVVFSFVGIEMVGLTAAETQQPDRVLPKAINDIPLRIILFYVGALTVMMAIYPWHQLSTAQSPFVQVFENIGIRAAAGIVNFVVLTAAASACNSALYSTGRMLFSLMSSAEHPHMRWLSRLSKNHVPVFALLFSTLVIASAVLLNLWLPDIVFTFISSVATTCFLFIWALIILAHLKYKKTPAARTTHFATPLFPWGDYFVLAFLGFATLVLCLNQATFYALMIAVVCIGGLYFWQVWRG